MKRRDKLDRWRTCAAARLTLAAGIPFWFGATPNERRELRKAGRLESHFRFDGDKRRLFRDYIRSLCGRTDHRSANRDRLASQHDVAEAGLMVSSVHIDALIRDRVAVVA